MSERSISVGALALGWMLVVLALGWAAPAAAGGHRLADLAWLAGCWEGEAGEECWLTPRGRTMLGINRSRANESGEAGFEYLRIVEQEDGALVYLASPGGRCPPTPFTAVEVAPNRVAFTNPEHDFPQRIVYWLEGDGTLHARVEAESDGQIRGFELVWRRKGWGGGS